ncbi:hypothetical protein D3C71_1821180 [compost metagenome]
MLPDRSHVLELVRIDDRVVKGQRDFEDGEDGADEENLSGTRKSTGRIPAEPGTESKADRRKDEGPGEVFVSRHSCPLPFKGRNRPADQSTGSSMYRNSGRHKPRHSPPVAFECL